MALAHFQRTFTDGFGNVQAGLSVEIRRESDGALAAIFSDADGNTPKSNPFVTDSNGYGDFYVVDGRYRIKADAEGIDWRNFDLLAGLGRTIYVGSVAELEALSLPAGYNVYLTEDGRAGSFVVESGDFSTELAADTLNGIYIGLSDDPTALTKVAKRRVVNNTYTPEMFGAITGADSTAIWNAMLSVVPEGATISGNVPGESYIHSGNVSGSKSVHFDMPDVTVTNSAGTFSLNGSITELVSSLTADATEGETSITVSDESVFTVGEDIIIQNDDPFSFSAHRTQYKEGEKLTVKSTAANTVTFESPLIASYPSASSIKFFSLSLIDVSLKGIEFNASTTPTDVLQLNLCKDIDVQCSSEGGSERSFLVRRCFGGNITGGRHRNAAADTGLQYGIVFANSSNIFVNGGDHFGTRHAVTTGGFDGDGAIPNRNLIIRNARLSSETNCAADFHGNSVNCYYDDCDITNRASIGGVDCLIRGGSLRAADGSALSPFEYSEIVGGKVGAVGTNIRMPLNSSASAASPISATSMETIDRDYHIYFDDITVDIPATNTAPQIIEFANYADGAIVEWDLTFKNSKVTGDVSSISRAVLTNISTSGGFATPPNPAKRLFVKNLDMDYSGLSQWVRMLNSSIDTGSVVTLPTIQGSGSLTIAAAASESPSFFRLQFPSYEIEPVNYVSSTGAVKNGGTYVIAIPEAVTAGRVDARLTTMHDTETVSTEVTATVFISVGLEEYVWP